MLDAVSGGRAYLGLAKGAWLDRLGIDEERPLATMSEAVEIVRALLSGDEGGVEGERFTLMPGTRLAYPRVRDSVPLLIGTWGRETARWAGTVADELKIGGTANPDVVPVTAYAPCVWIWYSVNWLKQNRTSSSVYRLELGEGPISS